MTEHYRRGDPETGCAYILLTAAFLFGVVFTLAVILLLGALS